MKTIIWILVALAMSLLVMEDIKERNLKIQAWEEAASPIMEGYKTPTPKNLKEYLQIQEKAKEIAGNNVYQKKWYLRDKTAHSITIVGNKREDIVFLTIGGTYSKYYESLRRGEDIIFYYRPSAALSAPSEFLMPVSISEK